jgi:cobalt/nickel transport system permease protein
MHVHLVDQYQAGHSLVHRLDPRVKVAVAVLLILLFNLTPAGAWPSYLLLLSLVVALALVAEVSPWFVLRRSLIVLPFALAAVTLLFTTPGEPLWQLPLVDWTVSQPGLTRFLSILFKSSLSVQVAIVLAVTTHFTDLLWALGSLRIPKLLIAIISFMYRYLFVLADEAFRMQRARQARSAAPAGESGAGGSLPWRAQVTGWMVGQLFLRSYERSERVYQAMAARGYQGEIRRLSPPPLRGRELVLGVLPVGAAGLIQLVSLLWWR